MTPYGQSEMHTPTLQAFAEQATVFEQAYVQSQMCVPTRNSFMSGRRPQTTRVMNDGILDLGLILTGSSAVCDVTVPYSAPPSWYTGYCYHASRHVICNVMANHCLR